MATDEFTFSVGRTVGTTGRKTQVTEDRPYFAIAKSLAVQQIDEAIAYWSDEANRKIENTPTILVPTKSGKFQIRPKISNKIWLFRTNESNQKVPHVIECSPEEVSEALNQLKSQTEKLLSTSVIGTDLYETYKSTKERRFAGYLNNIKDISAADYDRMSNDEKERLKEEWWSGGAKNIKGTPITTCTDPTP